MFTEKQYKKAHKVFLETPKTLGVVVYVDKTIAVAEPDYGIQTIHEIEYEQWPNYKKDERKKWVVGFYNKPVSIDSFKESVDACCVELGLSSSSIINFHPWYGGQERAMEYMLKQDEPFTRQSIAKEVNASVSTVAGAIDILLRQGELKYIGMTARKNGRRQYVTFANWDGQEPPVVSNKIVFDYIAKHGPATWPDIASKTEMEATLAKNLVGRMMKKKELVVIGKSGRRCVYDVPRYDKDPGRVAA